MKFQIPYTFSFLDIPRAYEEQVHIIYTDNMQLWLQQKHVTENYIQTSPRMVDVTSYVLCAPPYTAVSLVWITVLHRNTIPPAWLALYLRLFFCSHPGACQRERLNHRRKAPTPLDICED